MSGFDCKAFVEQMERWGLTLTAVPLADGKYRVNRWRMAQAAEHTQQIEEAWTTQIGDDQERMDQLVSYVYLTGRHKTTNRILSGLRKEK